MKKYFYWLLPMLIIVLALFHNSCNKCKGCGIILLPQTLCFKIVQNGKIITDSSYLSKIRIYYYKNGYEIDDPNDIDPSDLTIYDQHTLATFSDSSGLFASYFMTEISTKGQQYFYFEFPDGTVDTLFLNVEKVSDKEGIHEACHCSTPIRTIKFNGKIPQQNADNLRYINYYIFNK